MRVQVACAAALMLAGCAVLAPPIGRALPHGEQARTRAFQARVLTKFPVGSSDARLRSELKKQRFKVLPVDTSPTIVHYRYDFDAERSGLSLNGCRDEWNIYWAARNGRITVISASYDRHRAGAAC